MRKSTPLTIILVSLIGEWFCYEEGYDGEELTILYQASHIPSPPLLWTARGMTHS